MIRTFEFNTYMNSSPLFKLRVLFLQQRGNYKGKIIHREFVFKPFWLSLSSILYSHKVPISDTSFGKCFESHCSFNLAAPLGWTGKCIKQRCRTILRKMQIGKLLVIWCCCTIPPRPRNIPPLQCWWLNRMQSWGQAGLFICRPGAAQTAQRQMHVRDSRSHLRQMPLITGLFA